MSTGENGIVQSFYKQYLKDGSNASLYTKMNRFGYREFDGIRNTREYVFFTKPDLNILSSGGSALNPDLVNETYFREMFLSKKQVIYQLQNSVRNADSGGNFMFLLSNKLRSRVSMSNINTDSYESSANQFDTRIFTRKHSLKADNDYDITLDFEDSRELEIYHLFKMWDMYGNLKAIGKVKPDRVYMDRREIHDQISIYKFVVDETNANIIFSAKLTGVYPTGVPRDYFSDEISNLIYSIPFKVNTIIDNDPIIFEEFNYLNSSAGSNDLPLMTDYEQGSGVQFPLETWATGAYVEKVNNINKDGYKYRLKWRRS